MASSIVFDNAILLSHNVYKKGYGCKLNDLSIRDYNTGGFNDKIVSLDLDSYEKSVNPNSQNNTMDAAIGISNLQNNKRVNKRLLLVELRIGYDNADNIKGSELRHKSFHSRSILGREINIDTDDYFIFKDRIIHEAKNRVNKLALENGYKDKWHSLTVEEFNNLILDAEKLPYQPINDPAKISAEMKSCGNDINSIITISTKWLQEARNYVYRYNVNEAEIICNTSIQSLNDIIKKYHFDTIESEWYIEDLVSDFKGVLLSANKLREMV